MTDRQKAFASIFLGSLFGGGVAAVTKVGLHEIPPLSFAFIRFLLASVCIFPWLLTTRRNFTKEIVALAPLSLLATVNIGLFVVGIRTTTATVGQLLYAAVPLLTAAMAYCLSGERLTVQKIWGILIGGIGVILVLLLPVVERGGQFSGDLRGNLLIGLGVISWSGYMVLSKKAQKTYSPLVITSSFIFATALALLPLFLWEMTIHYGWWNAVGIGGWLSLTYVVFFATIGSYLLGQYAIAHGGSVFASLAFYITPVFAALVAFVLLGEKLTVGVLAGGALALLGIFIASW